MKNEVTIIKIGRPNPNPRNIQGECLLNGYKVLFNLQELPNKSLRTNWVVFPENTSISKIIPNCKSDSGHEYYAGLEIIRKIKKENQI